jgi:hypothetical protein
MVSSRLSRSAVAVAPRCPPSPHPHPPALARSLSQPGRTGRVAPPPEAPRAQGARGCGQGQDVHQGSRAAGADRRPHGRAAAAQHGVSAPPRVPALWLLQSVVAVPPSLACVRVCGPCSANFALQLARQEWPAHQCALPPPAAAVCTPSTLKCQSARLARPCTCRRVPSSRTPCRRCRCCRPFARAPPQCAVGADGHHHRKLQRQPLCAGPQRGLWPQRAQQAAAAARAAQGAGRGDVLGRRWCVACAWRGAWAWAGLGWLPAAAVGLSC